MIRLLIIFASGLALLLAGCSPPPAAPKSSGTGPHAEEAAAPSNRIAIPANVRSNLGITFAKVERRNILNSVRAPGSFELWPDAHRSYRTLADGRIELLVQQHDAVKPGDELFRYRPLHWPEYQRAIIEAELEVERLGSEMLAAEAAVQQSKSLVAAVEARIARLQEAGLVKSDVMVELANRRAAVPVAEAAIGVIKAKRKVAERAKESAVALAAAIIEVQPASLLETVTREGESLPRYMAIDWLTVKARHPGLVETLHVTDGAFANAADAIVSTVNLSRVRFRATGLQADMAIYASNEMAVLRMPGGKTLDVELHLGHDGDPEHRTLNVYGFVKDPEEWMIPGVSGYLEVATRDPKQIVLAIPRSAVVRDGIVHVFFKRDPNDANKAIRVEADLGDNDGYWIEIRSGLSVADEVVVDGAYELKLATAQSGTSQKGGHFHADGSYHAEDH